MPPSGALKRPLASQYSEATCVALRQSVEPRAGSRLRVGLFLILSQSNSSNSTDRERTHIMVPLSKEHNIRRLPRRPLITCVCRISLQSKWVTGRRSFRQMRYALHCAHVLVVDINIDTLS